jgi:hypothetical protein
MSTKTISRTEGVSELTAAVCKTAAWDCQTHSFLGSPATVSANLADLPDELVSRRVYMLAVQGDSRAEARIFERFNLEDSDGTVAEWAENDMNGLVTQITEVLVANRGVHCPGEQVKAAIGGDHELSVGSPQSAPKTAAEAFGPVLEAYAHDKFVQATVMVFC